MDYSDFVGEIQHRLGFGTQGEAVRATRAVLMTLGERIQEGAATDLASPLPMEIDYYLVHVDHAQQFGWDEFVSRVADRGEVEEEDAVFWAQAIVHLLAHLAPGSVVNNLRDQLPEEYDDLFDLVGVDTPPWEAEQDQPA